MSGFAALIERNRMIRKFADYTRSAIGEEVEQTIYNSVHGGKASGGQTLHAVAMMNSDLLGMSKEEVLDNPVVAMTAALTNNLGETAYQVYESALQNGDSVELASRKASQFINEDMLPRLKADPSRFIAETTGNRKGDIFFNADGVEVETRLTRQNIGTPMQAVVEKLFESTLVLRPIGNLIAGNGFSFRQTLRGAAMMENLYSANPEDRLISKSLSSAMSVAGIGLGIFETMLAGKYGGAMMKGSKFAPLVMPTFSTIKGLAQNYSNTYGLNETPTGSELATGAVFDFASSYLGMRYGNKIVDTAMALKLAPIATKSLEGLTKTDLFRRYVTTAIATPIVNTAFDMVVDYGTANFMMKLGLKLPENVEQQFNDLDPQDLLKAFGKRLMFVAGAGWARHIDQQISSKKAGDKIGLYGSMDYTDREFIDLVKSHEISKVEYNFGKIASAIGTAMSPGSLREVDMLVRQNPNLTGGTSDPSLIKNIMEAAGDGASYRKIIIANILNSEYGKNEVHKSLFTGTSFSARAVGRLLGVSTADMEAGMLISRDQSGAYNKLVQSVSESTDNLKAVINKENAETYSSLLADTIISSVRDLSTAPANSQGFDVNGNMKSIADDLKHLVNNSIAIQGDLGSNQIKDSVIGAIYRIQAENNAANTPIGRTVIDNAVKIVTDIFKDPDTTPAVFNDTTYTTRVLPAKDHYVSTLYAKNSGYRMHGRSSEDTEESYRTAIRDAKELTQQASKIAELRDDPLAKHNASIQAFYRTEEMDALINEIDAELTGKGTVGFKEFGAMNAFKKKVMESGRTLLLNKARSIVDMAKNEAIPNNTKFISIERELVKFRSIASILAGNITSKEIDNIRDLFKTMPHDIYSKNLSTIAGTVFKTGSINDEFQNIITYNSILTQRKNISVDLIQRIKDQIIGEQVSYNQLVTRFGDLLGTSQDFSQKNIERMVNAIADYMVTRWDTERSGDTVRLVPRKYNVTDVNGNVIKTEEYNDNDVDRIVGSVLDARVLPDNNRSADVGQFINKSAAIAVQRMFDQEIFQLAGSISEIETAVNDPQMVQRAINNVNGRLNLIAGNGVIHVHRGTIATGTNNDDLFDIYINTDKLTTSESYNRYLDRYIDGTLPQRRDRYNSTRPTNIIEEFIEHDYTVPVTEVILRKSGKPSMAYDVSRVIDEYNLFSSPESRTTMEYLLYLTTTYHQGRTDYGTLISLATRQIMIDNPTLLADIRRGVREKFPNAPEAHIQAEIENNLMAIAKQKLKELNIQIQDGATRSASFLHTYRTAVKTIQAYPGVERTITRFGNTMLIDVSHENANLSGEDIQRLDSQLRKDGLVPVYAVAANHKNVYALYPKQEMSREDAIHEVDRSIGDMLDTFGAARTERAGGQVINYAYDPSRNEFRIVASTDPNARTVVVTNYADILGAVRGEFIGSLSNQKNHAAMRRALFDLMGQIVDQVGGTYRPLGTQPVQEQELYRNILSEPRPDANIDLNAVAQSIQSIVSQIPQATSVLGNVRTISNSVDSLTTLLTRLRAIRNTSGAISGTADAEITSLETSLNDSITRLYEQDQHTIGSALLWQLSEIQSQKNPQSTITQQVIQEIIERNTIAATVNKAAITATRDQVWLKLKNRGDNLGTVTDDEIDNALILAMSTGMRSFAWGTQEEAVKRINSARIAPTMTLSQAGSIYDEVYGRTTPFRLVLLGDQKVSEGAIDDDGSLKIPPRLLDLIGFHNAGMINSSSKCTITYGMSLLKCMASASDSDDIVISIHNLKALSPMLANMWFPNGLRNRTINLSRDEAVQLIRSIAVHSTQNTKTITSEPNNQYIINPATGNLYRQAIDKKMFEDRIRKPYNSSNERGNSIGAQIRRPSDSTLGMIMPVLSQHHAYLDDSDRVMTNIIDQESNGRAMFLGFDLPQDVSHFSAIDNYRVDPVTNQVPNINRNGIHTSVGLGIKDLYMMASEYVGRSSREHVVPDDVTTAMTAISNVLSNREDQGRYNGNQWADLPPTDFFRYSSTLLDYLASVGHITKLEVTVGKDVNGKAITEPLYFANFERNGLDGPYHSLPAQITEIRNLSAGHYFAGNKLWAMFQSADFDGDQAIWRPMGKEGLRLFASESTGKEAGNDMAILQRLSEIDYNARVNTSLTFKSGIESDERLRPPRPQHEQYQMIFGQLFAPIYKRQLIGLDVLAHNNTRLGFASELNSIVNAQVSAIENKQLLEGVNLDDFNVTIDKTLNIFSRPGAGRTVLAYGNEEAIYPDEFRGSMKTIKYYTKDHLKALLTSTDPPIPRSDYQAVVLRDDNNKEYVFLMENDGKGFFNKVRAGVEINNEDADVDSNVALFIRTVFQETDTERRAGAYDPDVMQTRLKGSGLDVLSKSILKGLRLGQADEGIIQQLSSAGANAFKNVFQDLFYQNYMKNGELQTQKMLDDLNNFSASARIAGNINISSLENGRINYAFHDNKTFSRQISDSIPSIIRKVAIAANEDIAEPMKTLNDLYSGKSKDLTFAQVEKMIEYFRFLPETKMPQQMRKLKHIINERMYIRPDDKVLPHLGVDVASRAYPVNSMFYVKEIAERDDKLIKLSKVMDQVDTVIGNETTKGRLLSIATDLNNPALLDVDSRHLTGGRMTTQNLVNKISEYISQLKGSPDISEADVREILRDVGIEVSSESKTIVEINGDTFGNGLMDANALEKATKGLPAKIRALQNRDKVANLPVLSIKGKAASVDQLASALNKHMMNTDLSSKEDKSRIVFTGLLNSLESRSRVLLKLAGDGLSSKKAKQLGLLLDGTAEWRIEDPKALDELDNIDMFKLNENKRLFLDHEITDLLLDKTTGRYKLDSGC